MTLITALRCYTHGGFSGTLNRPAVVICADSQETAGDFRVEVQKIKPIDAGFYDLIIGGSGNIAPLIDGQAEAIERNVRTWPAGLSEEDVRTRLERVLRGYNARHVKDYPIADDSYPDLKVMAFVICTRDKTNSNICLWKTDATTIQRVGDYALVGWQEAAYHYHLKWLCIGALTKFRAALVGIQLLRSAQDNLYIGGPFHVIEVDKDGMRAWPAENVQLLGQRAMRVNATMAELLLTVPRLERSEAEFEQFLHQLEEAIRAFRVQQMDLLGEFADSYRASLRYEAEMDARDRAERKRIWEAAQKSAEPSDSETSEPETDS